MALHWEEIVYIAGLTHSSVLIAWGKFALDVDANGRAEIIDSTHSPRASVIGERTASWGKVRVDIQAIGNNADGAPIITQITEAPFVEVGDLSPNTEYRYTVTALLETGEFIWGGSPRRLRAIANDELVLDAPTLPHRRTFHTFPDPTVKTPPFRFFVVGDPGAGIERHTGDDAGQAHVAAAMVAAANDGGLPVRFILALGDLVYAKGSKGALVLQTVLNVLTHGHAPDVVQDSGNEDDDWFGSFFEPYRELLARVPVFAAVGNHDDGNEAGDDRAQMLDNLFLERRFAGQPTLSWTGGFRDTWRHGLFYAFDFGRDFRFAAMDTTHGAHWVRAGANRAVLDRIFAVGDEGPSWIVPFGHHPPFCLGPDHGYWAYDVKLVRDAFWTDDRMRKAGVPMSFWGHEHNFQHWKGPGHQLFVSGAAGKRNGGPTAEARDSALARTASEPDRPGPAESRMGWHFLDVVFDGAGETDVVWVAVQGAVGVVRETFGVKALRELVVPDVAITEPMACARGAHAPHARVGRRAGAPRLGEVGPQYE
jgi:tartrate-resistant acid phosphatase type 5